MKRQNRVAAHATKTQAVTTALALQGLSIWGSGSDWTAKAAVRAAWR